jgi:hypothetical protein
MIIVVSDWVTNGKCISSWLEELNIGDILAIQEYTHVYHANVLSLFSYAGDKLFSTTLLLGVAFMSYLLFWWPQLIVRIKDSITGVNGWDLFRPNFWSWAAPISVKKSDGVEILTGLHGIKYDDYEE